MCVLQKLGHVPDFCVKTLYNHIGRKNFPIKREHLPHGRYRRRKSENLHPCRKHKILKGESIDNRLERKLGKDTFTTLFKSITCDNGVEFQDFKGIEQSVYSKKKKRTKVYFAHPYSSFERGSNENANRLIRRFLPKGSTFDELSQKVVQRLARWMNKIPRKLFDGKSANEMVKALGLNFGDAKH